MNTPTKLNLFRLITMAAAMCLPPLTASGDAPAIATPPPAAFVGIFEDPLWNFKSDELSTFTAMLTETGARSIRIPVRWSVLEPQKGKYSFAPIERILEAIPPNVEILGTLMSVPPWANGMHPGKAEGWADTYPPKDLADWERYVFETVSHFKGRIHHWEIWNEQNGVDFYRPLPDADAYTTLLKLAYRAAKRADPDCVVVLGGLQMNGIIPNPWSSVKTPNFLEALYKAGARPYFDVCNIHPYVLPEEGAAHMMSLIRDSLALMDRYGDTTKTIWLTEVGCGATTQSAEQDQAKLLADTFKLASQEPRIGRVFWFLLRDMEKDLLGPEASMGVFSISGRAKPALSEFKKAAANGVAK